jgi:F-type H+-transporting ATPase subunit gamma
MPSLKTLKLRIKSIRSTQKITKAMKMVATSKLKRAREKAESSAEYANQMLSMVKSISKGVISSCRDGIKLLRGSEKDDVNLIVLITSDRGLCGPFNQNVIKLARQKIKELESQQKKVKLILVGSKGYDALKKTHAAFIIENYKGLGHRGITFFEAKNIADNVLNVFEKKEIDTCTLIYNKFKSVISQIPTEQKIIPLSSEEEGIEIVKDSISNSVSEYEPSKEEILLNLLPKNIAVQIYRALLESNASEHGARMTAMENATRNSGDMIKRLNLIYNRTRQAYITKELIEIISGAEAS